MEKNKRKRALRRYQEKKHFKKRLKRLRKIWDLKIPSIPEEVDVDTLLKHYKWLTVYKNTGTPCSCSMCSGEKYDRLRSKKEFKRSLKEWEEEIGEMDLDRFIEKNIEKIDENFLN